MIDFEAKGSFVIKNLLHNEGYFTKVFSNLSNDFFISSNLEIFKVMSSLYSEYGRVPTPKEVGLKLADTLPNTEYKTTVIEHFKELVKDNSVENDDFLSKETTEFIKQSEFKFCILKAADNLKNGKDLGEVYDRLGEAMSFSLDMNIGITDDDMDIRDELRREQRVGLSTGIATLDNLIGGFYNKTLNVICAVTHGGKSMFLTHFSATQMLQGKNGIYVTLEMSEGRIWDRIDANVLAIDSGELKNYDMSEKYEPIKDKLGKLTVKEYGAGTATAITIENLYKEVIKQFRVDYICIDYATLMSSYSVSAKTANSFTYYTKVYEELHSLCKKLNIPIITAAQLNRDAFKTDGEEGSGIQNIGQSLGIAQTSDTLLSISRSKSLDELNLVLMKILKDRNKGSVNETFYCGVNFAQSRFFDDEEALLKIASGD